MLVLWLNNEYRHDDWNIMGTMTETAKLFRWLRLPSTTTRIPRSFMAHRKFKTNELRVLPIFGHTIFKKFLRKKDYTHLLQLVVILHTAEARAITRSQQEILKRLHQTFVVSFPRLYTDRHCVQVIHSVINIPDTVNGFGPLTNYTTFQLENDLGRNSSS